MSGSDNISFKTEDIASSTMKPHASRYAEVVSVP
jgi:hypothetical protein